MKLKVFLIVYLLCLIFPLNLFSQQNPETQLEKEKIAVLGFTGPVDSWIKEAVTNKLEAQLANLGRFRIVNRRNIDAALKELSLGLTGLTDDSQAFKLGKHLSANKLIVGTVDYCNIKRNQNTNIFDVVLSITANLISVEKNVVKEGISITGSGHNENEKMAIANSIKRAIEKFLLKVREIYSLKATTIKVDEGVVYINIGKEAGIKSGFVFKVYRQGEIIEDTITHKVYGYEEDNIGLIRAQSVYPQYTKCKILRGRSKIRERDKIKEVPGYKLTKVFVQFGVSQISVKAAPNIAITDTDINYAKYYGFCLLFENMDRPVAFEIQGGHIDLNNIGGFAGDVTLKTRLSIIPEIMQLYVGTGIGFIWAKQELSEPDSAKQGMNISTEETRVRAGAFSYLASVSFRLSLIKNIHPFAEFGWRHYNTLKDWEIKYGKNSKLVVPDQYIDYPVVDIEGLSFRLGLIINF